MPVNHPPFETTHGMTGTPEHRSWKAMKARCLNPKSKGYERYGGSGISVCERWMKFENFYADMGDRPVGTSLERIDNSRGYEPGNCRWATAKEQSLNRRSKVIIEKDGVRRHLTEWARELGIPQALISERIRRGWTPEDAIRIGDFRKHSGRPGERNPNAKLSDATASVILQNLASGTSAAVLASRYGVDKSTIFRLRRRLIEQERARMREESKQ